MGRAAADFAADLALVESRTGHPYGALIAAGRADYAAIVREKAASIRAGTWPAPRGPARHGGHSAPRRPPRGPPIASTSARPWSGPTAGRRCATAGPARARSG